MKILDRYFVKQFLQTVFFGIIAFTIIFVVIDMMENLDDFIDQKAGIDIILHYYFVFSPEMIKLVTPISVLFSALFIAGKASSSSELTAIKASGVSMYRFMLPFLAASFLISLFSIYFTGYLVPMANKTKINIERTYLNRGFSFAGSNLFFQDSKDRIISISFFDDSRNQANRISIQEFADDNPTKMTTRIDAANMIFDTLKNDWVAHNGVKRKFTDRKESAEYFSTMTLDNLNFTNKDLINKQQKPEEMNLTELKKLITAKVQAGNDPTAAMIEYYSRFAFPMASLIVVLFGLPISANRQKGGVAVQVGISILLTFIYLVSMKISQAFGKNGALNPFLTAWVANFIFLAAALINIPRMKQ